MTLHFKACPPPPSSPCFEAPIIHWRSQHRRGRRPRPQIARMLRIVRLGLLLAVLAAAWAVLLQRTAGDEPTHTAVLLVRPRGGRRHTAAHPPPYIAPPEVALLARPLVCWSAHHCCLHFVSLLTLLPLQMPACRPPTGLPPPLFHTCRPPLVPSHCLGWCCCASCCTEWPLLGRCLRRRSCCRRWAGRRGCLCVTVPGDWVAYLNHLWGLSAEGSNVLLAGC